MKFVIEHLEKHFDKKEVLKDINFAFEEGMIYGLLGRNGAGKTTTMAAKVKFLVEQRNVSPSKIAVISYTNQATEELEERIRYEFHLPVHVMTFHSLGMQVVRHMFNTPLKPVVEGEQKQIIIDFVKQKLFPNPSLLDDYVETFNAYKVGEYPLFSKGFSVALLFVL